MNLSNAKDILTQPQAADVTPNGYRRSLDLLLTKAFLDGQRTMQMMNFLIQFPEREECPRYRAEIERLKTLYLGPSKEPQP